MNRFPGDCHSNSGQWKVKLALKLQKSSRASNAVENAPTKTLAQKPTMRVSASASAVYTVV